jgi:uncharacterized protein YdeI (YjbR/CyaY-like superfamily)
MQQPIQNEISDFTHALPADMKKAINSDDNIKEAWAKITPLAQNEWICWTTIVKQEKTRLEHVERMKQDLLKGKKRPCCWPGCPHRRPSAAKYFKPILKGK